jgi:SAM-dependent methyltransferase
MTATRPNLSVSWPVRTGHETDKYRGDSAAEESSGDVGQVDRVQVRPAPVTVEDDNDLDRSLVRGDRMRRHRRELRGLAGLDQDDATPEMQPRGAGQHREPLVTRMDVELGGRAASGDPHLRDSDALRLVLASQHPARRAVVSVSGRPDDDVGVGDRLDELVETAAERSRDQDELVDRDTPMTGLDAAQCRRADMAASGKRVERPAASEPQPPNSSADDGVEVDILRHWQEPMPRRQSAPSLSGMPDTASHNDHSTLGANTHGAHGHAPDGHSADDFASLLDLDAEVLHAYWSAALDYVRAAAADTGGGRLLDLGAGTGTGAMGLARRFPTAEVVALDLSAASLDRLRTTAAEAGIASRVIPLEADIDAGWPAIGTLDVTWASMSLHHFANPDQVMRDVLASTRPGGLLAVAEFAEPIRFLPDDLGFGRPGFEARIGDIIGAARTEEMPTLGTAWAPRVAAAGWTVVDERNFTIDLDPPRHPKAAAYAVAWFDRLAHGMTDRLESDDQTTLEQLLDERGPYSLLARTDLHIRGVRSVTIGRRD